MSQMVATHLTENVRQFSTYSGSKKARLYSIINWFTKVKDNIMKLLVVLLRLSTMFFIRNVPDYSIKTTPSYILHVLQLAFRQSKAI